MLEVYRGNYDRYMSEGAGIYHMGLPGLGEGSSGRVYVVADPREYLQVIQNEGKFPSGILEALWPLSERLKRQEQTTNIFERGEGWKRERSFIQRNLLAPGAAKGYIPGIVEAARLASRGAGDWGDQFNIFTARASFDLFNAAFFGKLARTADAKNSQADPRDMQFCDNVLRGFDLMVPILLSPSEKFIIDTLGLSTSRFDKFCDSFNRAQDRVTEMIDDFMRSRERGELQDWEKTSYCFSTLDYYEKECSDMNLEDIKTLFFGLLTAAVDTTSGVINWILVHLALNPEVQDKLYAEMETQNFDIAKILLQRKEEVPYLHAIMRESHRLSPTVPVSLMKKIHASIQLSGFDIPTGSRVLLDTYSMSNDPAIVPRPEEFLPERFLPDAVESRKGTRSEIIDHPLCSGPFSAGARKCPGSRVANYEILTMISTLVTDWKITLDDPSIKCFKDVKYHYGNVVQPKPMPRLKLSPRT